MRLAAGLCPDPLGELKGGEGRGEEGKERKRKRGEGFCWSNKNAAAIGPAKSFRVTEKLPSLVNLCAQ